MDNLFEIILYTLIIISFISSLVKKKPQQNKTDGKQPVNPNTGRQNVAGNIQENAKETSKPVEFDLAKEIENFFNVGQPAGTVKQADQNNEIKREIESRADFPEVPEESFHTSTASEHSFSNKMQRQREGYKTVPEKSFHQQSTSEHTFKDPWDTKSDVSRQDYKRVPEQSFHQQSASEHTIQDRWKPRIRSRERAEKSSAASTGEKADNYEKYLNVKETSASNIVRTIKERISNPATLKEYIIISEIIGKPKALRR